MYYHIILTERCDSKCKYCYEKSMKEWDNGLDKKWVFDCNVPSDAEFDLSKLKKFIDKDENPIVIFYGGEPLIRNDKIIDIINALGKNVSYRMQSNGKLLPKLPFNYLKKIDKMLISIDGDEDRTDWNRGRGTYKIVINNLRKIREMGYNGEIVARMTLSFPDVDYQVKEIVKLMKEGLFDSVHWQIDAGFYKNDFDYVKHSEFFKEYNSQIDDLIDYWINYMGDKRKVLKIYPFLGIFESLYYNKSVEGLRCGAGYVNYTITTNGKIVACPIMNNIEDFFAGDLESNPSNLKKFSVDGRCVDCGYLDLCGGRCLYSNKARLWPEEGERMICDSVINLIEGLKKRMGEIVSLIDEGIVSERDFFYEKYFGPEIIP